MARTGRGRGAPRGSSGGRGSASEIAAVLGGMENAQMQNNNDDGIEAAAPPTNNTTNNTTNTTDAANSTRDNNNTSADEMDIDSNAQQQQNQNQPQQQNQTQQQQYQVPQQQQYQVPQQQQQQQRRQRPPRQQPPPEPQYPPPPPRAAGSYTIPTRRLNEPASVAVYRSTFLRFMSYTNKVAYPKDYVFSIEELALITPEHIHAWMCYKTYGKEDVSPNDKPMFAMQNAIKGWKKHISFYFNAISSQPWSSVSRTGKPTKATIINDLIAIVGQKETKGLGLPSNQDRPFEKHEFVQILDTLRSSDDDNLRYRYPAMLTFMFHLIARGDDAGHVFKNTLLASSIYLGCLTTKLRWSKNVRERRDCPKQILLGSMNPIFCVLLSLAIFLEQWIGNGAGMSSQWLFCEGTTTPQSPVKDMKKEVDRTKDALYNAVKDVYDSPTFTVDEDARRKGPLGVHSTKKFATTKVRNGGAPKDNVDYRARWRNKRIQEVYADVELPWPDIQVASKLCVGGVCMYKLKDGCGLSNEWLVQHVTPAIRQCFGNRVAGILAKPLLWACLDAECASMVPDHIRVRVLNALHAANEQSSLPAGENCVEKIRMIATEYDGQVSLDEVPEEYTAVAGAGGRGSDNDWKNMVYAKMCGMARDIVDIKNTQASHHTDQQRQARRLERNVNRVATVPGTRVRIGGGGGASGVQDIVDIKNTQASHHTDQQRQARRLERNVNRVATVPGTRVRIGGGGGASGVQDIVDIKNTQASHHTDQQRQARRLERNVNRVATVPGTRVRIGGGGGASGVQDRPAVLSKVPKNLYVLWEEYESGLGNNKAARMFTAQEKGKVKFTYCRRKIVWDVIDNMCNRHISSDTAIDMIYEECGGSGTPVNTVIKKLKQFRTTGNDRLHIDRRPPRGN